MHKIFELKIIRYFCMCFSSTTIHNSCKKLAQLNRVIEYLTSYIEEVHFQTVTIEKDVDAEYQTIFKNYEKKASAIFNDIEEQVRSVAETLQGYYKNRFETENQKFQEKKEQIFKYLNNEEQIISIEIQNLLSTISNIQQNTQNHIVNFDNQNHTLNFQSEIKNLEKEKEKEIRDFDKENNEKIKKLKDHSEKQLKDIENHFAKVKNDLIISYEKDNPILPNIQKVLETIIQKVKVLKAEVSSLTKNLNNEQIISSQNFSGFKARLISLIDQMKNIEKENAENLEKIQNKNKDIYDKMKSEIREQNNNKNKQIQIYENEILNLQNEQRMIKSQIKTKFAQLDKQKEKKSSRLDSEIEAKKNELQNKIEDMKKSIKKEEEEINLRIGSKEEEIRKRKIEFQEIELNTSNSKKELLTKFSDEIENFKISLQKEKEKEEELYNQKYNDIHESLNTQIDNYKKSEEANEEIQKLKNELNSINSNFASELSQIENSSNFDNNQYEDELKNLSVKLDEEFNDKQKLMKEKIDLQNSIFSEEEEKFKEKLELKHKEEIEKVPKNFKDDDFKDKINYYEKEFKQTNQQLQSIQVMSKDEIAKKLADTENDENSPNYFNNKKTLLIEFISKERNDMLTKFKDEEKQIIEKMPTLIDQNSIQINTSEFERFTNNSKKRIENFQSKINELEKELNSLREENQNILDDIESRKNFDDDSNVQKLRLRLQSDQEKSNDKINSEKARFDEIIKSLQSQIQLAEQQNESELRMVQNNIDKDHKTFRDSFQERSTYRKSMKEEQNELFLKEQKKYEEEKIKMVNDFDKNIKEMHENIDILRNKVDSMGNEQLKSEIDKMNLVLQEKIEKQKIEYDNEIEKMISMRDTIKNQSVLDISQVEERRNKLMESVKARPMRDEEKNIIEKLSSILNDETEKLKNIGMEFLDMRESLAIRDKQINQRFGNVPQVFDTRKQRKSGGSASSLVRKKPLPPLASPYVFI